MKPPLASTSTQKPAPLLLALLFCAALALPSLFWALGGRPIYPFGENRSPAAWPQPGANLKEWISAPRQVEVYYNDRFGLRDVLLHLRHSLLLNVLHTSPVNEVVLGRDGWLFTANPTGPDDQFLGVVPLTGAQLATLQEKIAADCAPFTGQGIPCYLVVPPDKESVYPEYLPGGAGSMDTQTRLREFYRQVRVPAGVRLVNPLDAILALKGQHTLYFSTDTHWNDFAAAATASQVVRAMQADFPQFNPRPLSDFAVVELPTQGRDLATMIGAPEMPDVDYQLRAGPWSTQALPDGASLVDTGHAGPVLLLVRDSFGDRMLGYLVSYFSRILIVPVENDPLPYLQSQPVDVVLFEVVERGFLYYP